MNQTNFSKQVASFVTAIEALTPRAIVARKPLNNSFKYISSDHTRTWENEGGTFRNFTFTISSTARGGFVETAGQAGSKRYNNRTSLALFVVYPLHIGDNAERLVDASNADELQLRATIENPANWLTGVNGAWVVGSSQQQVGQHNRILVMIVDLDTTEVVQ